MAQQDALMQGWIQFFLGEGGECRLLLYLFLLCPVSDPRWFSFFSVYFRNMPPVEIKHLFAMC